MHKLAGNRESVSPGIQVYTRDFLIELLKDLDTEPETK